MRSLLLVALACGVAAAHPPPELATDPPIEWRHDPARFEWSTWLGFGLGVAASPAATVTPAAGARTTQPTAAGELGTAWTFSAGAEVTLPVTHSLRVGPWVGLHDLEPMAGGELQLTRSPASLDLFFYAGEGVWTVRAGGGPTHATATIAWGYRCPWKLWGPYTRTSRYEIGPRITLAATRAYTDPRDWSATIGLEVEPVGALRYLLGIKSWY